MQTPYHFAQGFEHPRTLVPVEGPRNKITWIPRDNSIINWEDHKIILMVLETDKFKIKVPAYLVSNECPFSSL